jgi:membrane-associated phospholipid phosphatase
MRRGLRVAVHLPAELAIPLVPAMSLAYVSLYALLLLAPFVLRTRGELRAFVLAMAVAILLAGVGFLLVPAALAFPPASGADLGRWAGLFRVADGLNLTYNLVPSLHVAFAVLCAAVFGRRAAVPGRAALWTWAALIAASTLLTHQHHLVDVASGAVLGLGCASLAFRRFVAGRASPSTLQ